MATGIKTESNAGDFLPRIQYDAKAGRFFKIDRVQSASGWENDTSEIMLPTAFAMDFDNLEVGWIKLGNGVDFQMSKLGKEPMPPQPGERDAKGVPTYRQGFRIKVFNKQIEVRTFSHSAKCVIAAIDVVHDRWLVEKDSQPGRVPVISVARTIAVTTGTGAKKSTNYAPEFTISQWIPRPAGFDEKAAASNGNGNGHVAANPAVPPPQGTPAAAVAAAPAQQSGTALF